MISGQSAQLLLIYLIGASLLLSASQGDTILLEISMDLVTTWCRTFGLFESTAKLPSFLSFTGCCFWSYRYFE